MARNNATNVPFIDNIALVADVRAPALQPCCDVYGRIVPVNKSYDKPPDSDKTKLGYDACLMPDVMRQKCPCCGFRQTPLECCSRSEVYPQSCAYDPSDKQHQKIYGVYYDRFNNVCEERLKKK